MSRRRSRLASPPDFASQPVASSSRSQPMFASQSVSRSSNASQRQSLFNESDLEESVNSAVMIALNLAGGNKPFKRTDLLQGCRVKNRAAIESIIRETQKLLLDIYGLKLVEIPPGKFILVLPKDAALRSEFAAKSDAVTPAFSSMLGVILTLIFIQKGRLAEEYLKNTMLPKLFPDIGMNPHPYFGNVDKLFLEFEHMGYITKETEARGGENKVFYRWGIRADHEINKKALVVPVIKTMFGGNVPHSLLAQLEKEGPATIEEDED